MKKSAGKVFKAVSERLLECRPLLPLPLSAELWHYPLPQPLHPLPYLHSHSEHPRITQDLIYGAKS